MIHGCQPDSIIENFGEANISMFFSVWTHLRSWQSASLARIDPIHSCWWYNLIPLIAFSVVNINGYLSFDANFVLDSPTVYQTLELVFWCLLLLRRAMQYMFALAIRVGIDIHAILL